MLRSPDVSIRRCSDPFLPRQGTLRETEGKRAMPAPPEPDTDPRKDGMVFFDGELLGIDGGSEPKERKAVGNPVETGSQEDGVEDHFQEVDGASRELGTREALVFDSQCVRHLVKARYDDPPLDGRDVLPFVQP